MAQNLSIKIVRTNCLECSGDSQKAVLWCSCVTCQFWRFRFGVNPRAFIAKHGPRLLTPSIMPPADVHIDDLPSGVHEASTAAIKVPGYEVEAVTIKAPKLTKAQRKRRQEASERLARAREARAAR